MFRYYFAYHHFSAKWKHWKSIRNRFDIVYKQEVAYTLPVTWSNIISFARKRDTRDINRD